MRREALRFIAAVDAWKAAVEEMHKSYNALVMEFSELRPLDPTTGAAYLVAKAIVAATGGEKPNGREEA